MSDDAALRPTSNSLAEQARQQYRLLKIGVLALLVLACAIPFSLNLVDPDLWGHIRYGQDWLAAGEMPRTATHTYTAVDHPWVNHENAAELLMAIGYDRIGIYGMLVVKCIVGLAIVATMAWTAMRHGVPAISAWALLLLVASNLQAFFPLRPQLLSFVLSTAALVCLDRGFFGWTETRRVRFAWLWPLPAIFALWVNSHGGFVAGLCIVGTLLLGRMAELLLRDGLAARGKLVHLAAIGLACLGATVINPYGLGMHAWLWSAWGGAPPEITEWAAPRLADPVFWPFVTLMFVAAASLAATRRRRDWTQIIILSLVAWQACMHLRHIAFLALLCGFWLPVHWHSALARLRPDRQRLPIMLPALWMRLAMAAVIVMGIALQSSAIAKRLSDLPVLKSQYPVDAIQFMADNKLTGRLVVAFNWAQYALAALAPEVTVGFDGRFDTCYPQEAIDVHFDFLLGDCTGPRERHPDAGPIDGARVLKYHRPDMVLVERRFKHAAGVMEEEADREDSEWTLLYRDAVAELWGRRDRFGNPFSPDYLAVDARRIGNESIEDRQDAGPQWPAMPEPRAAKQSSASPLAAN